jgi:hypothetical protein
MRIASTDYDFLEKIYDSNVYYVADNFGRPSSFFSFVLQPDFEQQMKESSVTHYKINWEKYTVNSLRKMYQDYNYLFHIKNKEQNEYLKYCNFTIVEKCDQQKTQEIIDIFFKTKIEHNEQCLLYLRIFLLCLFLFNGLYKFYGYRFSLCQFLKDNIGVVLGFFSVLFLCLFD